MLTLEKMIEEMDKHGVSKTALISPMNETMFEVDSAYQHNMQRLFRFLILQAPSVGLQIYNGLVKNGHLHLYGNKYKIYSEPRNDLVEDAIKRFPNRFLGWAAFNPIISESLEEVEHYLSQPGFIGVKAHPFMHQYKIEKLAPVAALCESKGVPIIIHLSSEQDSYKYLPEHFTNLKIVYAHAGLPFWKKLWTYIADKQNVYVDTSSDYLTPAIVKKAVETLGYRKVLYGCDGPYGMTKFNEYNYGEKKRWIEELRISDREKEYILGKNFLSLIE